MKPIKTPIKISLIFCLMFFSFSFLQSQVRIGYKSTELESPDYSLLELSSDTTEGEKGKGLLLPRVTQTQMETMQQAPGVPDGMLIFNVGRKALMVKQDGYFQAFTSKLSLQKTFFTNPDADYDGNNPTFTLETPPIENGVVLINYNHTPLLQDIDFRVAGAQIEFLTMLPDQKNAVGVIYVEK